MVMYTNAQLRALSEDQLISLLRDTERGLNNSDKQVQAFEIMSRNIRFVLFERRKTFGRKPSFA
jgi:hypothetical protein